MRPDDVLDFWFPKSPAIPMDLWFGGSPATDAEIERRFGATLREACAGAHDAWAENPAGCLALVVLLDQFSLNVRRDQARSFTQAHLALPFALGALSRGWDAQLEPRRRVFLYLPLEHSEDRELQELSVQKFRTLRDEASAEVREAFDTFLDYAIQHRDIVARFGRFPGRNAILSRPALPEEDQFLADGGAWF